MGGLMLLSKMTIPYALPPAVARVMVAAAATTAAGASVGAEGEAEVQV